MGIYYQKTIESLVSPRLVTCAPDTPVHEAARQMREALCGSIIVLDGQGQPAGIWTEADVLKLDLHDPDGLRVPISSVMSSPVKTLPVDTPFHEAAIRFRHEGIRHYLVIDQQNQPRGILSQTDIVLNQGAEFFIRLKEVGSIPSAPPRFLRADASFAEAVAAMRQVTQEAVIIEYPDGGYGILTQRDVVRHLDSNDPDQPVGRLASRPLVTAKASASLYYARKLLAEKHIRHLGITSENNQLTGLVGFADIMASIEHEYVHELQYALKERDEALNLSQQNLRLADKVFEATLEGIIITDAEGIIETVNPAFTRITGWRREEVVGKNPRILSSSQQPPEFYRHLWQSLREHGFWQGEVINRRKDGKFYTEHLTITGIRGPDGTFTHYAGIFSDITQRKLNEERLHYLANHDPLTDLPNRTLLMERLSAALNRAHRQGKRVALMFLDLDRFKFINDTLGHAVGDKLLQTVASRLTGSLRASDTVARLGGDEFNIVLEDIRDLRGVAQTAQKLIDRVQGMVTLDGHDVYVTASIGIAIYPDDGGTPEVLRMNADTAMYRAKERGKNNFQFFTADMNASTLARLRLESSLHRALACQEFQLHFQPKIDLVHGHIYGMEALLRWHSHELGPVSPADFIPIAEESNLISTIGEWVLEQACRQARHWLNLGLLPGTVAVNLSSKQMTQGDIVATVRRILEHSNLPGHYLELEITESVAMDNTGEMIRTLKNLKALGVRIAIDDFGTGYSSLSYLKQLPVDVLKIDRSFVTDLHENRDDAAIASAIISMGQSLNLQPVAEGVEREEHRQFLLDHGCQYGQGYLFSRPVPAAAMEQLLLESQALSAWR